MLRENGWKKFSTRQDVCTVHLKPWSPAITERVGSRQILDSTGSGTVDPSRACVPQHLFWDPLWVWKRKRGKCSLFCVVCLWERTSQDPWLNTEVNMFYVFATCRGTVFVKWTAEWECAQCKLIHIWSFVKHVCGVALHRVQSFGFVPYLNG